MKFCINDPTKLQHIKKSQFINCKEDMQTNNMNQAVENFTTPIDYIIYKNYWLLSVTLKRGTNAIQHFQ